MNGAMRQRLCVTCGGSALRGFRVSVDLSAWYPAGDARRTCLVWVSARARARLSVRWLAARLRARLGLRAAGALALALSPAGPLLPPREPLALLRAGDALRVIPMESEPFLVSSDEEVLKVVGQPEAPPPVAPATRPRFIPMECEGLVSSGEEQSVLDDSVPPTGQPVPDLAPPAALRQLKQRAMALLEQYVPPASAPSSPPPQRRARRRVRRRPRARLAPEPLAPDAPHAPHAPVDATDSPHAPHAPDAPHEPHAPVDAIDSPHAPPTPTRSPPAPPNAPSPAVLRSGACGAGRLVRAL